MSIVISALDPPSGPPVAISVKLNTELIDHLKRCVMSDIVPKLVVKNGNYSIRISNEIEFPCSKIPEHLNVDVYSVNDSHFNGRVSTKLNPITDPKKIKEFQRGLELKKKDESTPSPHIQASPSNPKTVLSSQNLSSMASSSSANSRRTSANDNSASSSRSVSPSKSRRSRSMSYQVLATDSNATLVLKFLNLLALGPQPVQSIAKALNVSHETLSHLLTENAQVYSRNAFVQDDKYPLVERVRRRRIRRFLETQSDGDDSEDEAVDAMVVDSDNDDDAENNDLYVAGSYILKDKAYKELKPWEWNHYTAFERRLIIANINRALTRLGYSETHPLRKKICEKGKPGPAVAVAAPVAVSSSSLPEEKTPLGGGFLISSKKTTPFRKSHTDSPKLTGTKEIFERKVPSSVANSPKMSLPRVPAVAKNAPKMSTLQLNSPKSTSSARNQTPPSTQVKRKFSSSSGTSSSSDDEKLQMKKMKAEYTSPSSEEEKLVPKASKRIEYYTSLASKFKLKYKEYELLYRRLKNDRNGDKKMLVKLFELHNSLSQWKKTLWDYEREIKQKEKIMGLSKHKKSPNYNSYSSGSVQTPSQAQAASGASGVKRVPSKAKLEVSLDY